MSATIELDPAHEAILHRIARDKGGIAPSLVVAEALEALARDMAEAERLSRVQAAIDALSGFDPKAGEEMATRIEEARRAWRSSV